MKLELLGLNEYESKAYQAIIDLGESKSHQISAKSGVPYGRIYDVLNTLEAKGLIKLTLKKPKTYVAIDPELILIKQIEKQISELEELKEETKQLKKKYERFPEEAVYVVKGKENFNRLIGSRKEPEEFDYAIRYVFDPHPVWLRKAKNLISKGVDVRTIGPMNEQTEGNMKKWIAVGDKVKIFPNEGIAIDILDGKTVIIGLIKSDATLVINDLAYGKLMTDLFKAAWKTSREVKN